MMFLPAHKELTHGQLEMHGCVLSTVATDDQAISTHSAD